MHRDLVITSNRTESRLDFRDRVFRAPGSMMIHIPVFYLILQEQKSAQRYIPQGYFPQYEAVSNRGGSPCRM
jgi:hypothetical protein